MLEKDKQLLITDLCTRLPYGVWVECCGVSSKLDNIWLTHFYNGGDTVVGVDGNTDFFHDSEYFDITKIKPYLRPMSSMTEEEKKEDAMFFRAFSCSMYERESVERIDWLNARHFDYRGLIEKGLGLEAPEGLYAIK